MVFPSKLVISFIGLLSRLKRYALTHTFYPILMNQKKKSCQGNKEDTRKKFHLAGMFF